MTDEEFLEEFKALFKEEFSIPEEKVSLDAMLVQDLGLDSLDLVAAALAIEDKWGVRVEDDDLAEVKTVRDAVDLVSARLGAGS